ncbi:MAG: gamma-glutamylcyclotransferase family protein [Gracilimonas sp.]|nr:gamma-glutamylcyclotransferase family protein [Gracilimonas sp.]
MNLYFAYGSNLHPIRLEERLGKTPYMGKGKLHSTEIHFHKTGSDGSGKATIQSSNDLDSVVWGAVYNLSQKQEKILDKFESLGAGYNKLFVDVEFENGETRTCFTYQGMTDYVDFDNLPFHWYKQLVIAGAEYLKFPQNYLSYLLNVESVEDPNSKRASVNQRLLKLMDEKK